MTTHRNAWLQRAGVVVALTTSALLALPAASAMAATGKVQNVSASPSSIDPGGTTTVSYEVQTTPPGDRFTVNIGSSNPRLACVSGCTANQDGPFRATFRYANAASANENAVITVRASGGSLLGGGTWTDDGSTPQITLVAKPAAPQQPETVKEISGRVTDSGTGNPVPNATVGIRDSANHSYSTTTNDSGSYRFTGSTGQPIAPGQIIIGAAKDDITGTRTITGAAGQSLTNQKITLKLTAATPTATPSATESAADQPTDTPGNVTDTPAAGQPAAGNQKSSGTSMGSLLLILVGGLLVALGVGAIVLLWMRRKDNGDDEPDGPGAGAGGPRGAVPPGQGGYGDQTRVANRAGMGADPTMVGGAALADAPTMMHNRPLVDDEFPDPYGAPLPVQHPGYGAADQDWAGDGYAAGAAAPTQAGYGAGAAAGGYGNAPGSGAGYGNASSSGSGYDNAPGSGAGYGNGNAPSSGSGYDNAPGSGAGYSGRDYGAAGEPAGYPARAAGGHGERFDEPTGRYQGGGGDDYGQPADPYETGTYNASGGGHGAGQQQYGEDAGYGQRAGYGDQNPNGGGYDADGGYGSGGRGYGQQQGYGAQQGGYDQPAAGGGYDQQGGDDQGQHGDGYDQRGADQGYYGNRDAGGRARQDGPEQANRSGRRSLDWLDD